MVNYLYINSIIIFIINFIAIILLTIMLNYVTEEIVFYISCCGLSQSRHKHGKKDAYSLYNWIVYKQRSKAKEKERKRQAATREVIYNY